MTNEGQTPTSPAEKIRRLAAYVSAISGVIGFATGWHVATGIALGCAIVWIGGAFITGAATVDRITKEDK